MNCTISAARARASTTRPRPCRALLQSELQRYSPAAGPQGPKIKRFKVIKEKRATISHAAGTYHCRPEVTGPVRGLYMAGDWVRTGLPATIESAVQSGHDAAKAILTGERNTGRRPGRAREQCPRGDAPPGCSRPAACRRGQRRALTAGLRRELARGPPPRAASRWREPTMSDPSPPCRRSTSTLAPALEDLAAAFRQIMFGAGNAGGPAVLVHDLDRHGPSSPMSPPPSLRTLRAFTPSPSRPTPLDRRPPRRRGCRCRPRAASIEEESTWPFEQVVRPTGSFATPPSRPRNSSPEPCVSALRIAAGQHFAEIERIAAFHHFRPAPAGSACGSTPASPRLALALTGDRSPRQPLPASPCSAGRAITTPSPATPSSKASTSTSAPRASPSPPDFVDGVDPACGTCGASSSPTRNIPIDMFDLGGGLLAHHRDDAARLTPTAYAAALRAAIPELFTADVQLVPPSSAARCWPTAASSSRASRSSSPAPSPSSTSAPTCSCRRVLPPATVASRLPGPRPRRPAPRRLRRSRTTLAGPLCFGGDLRRARPPAARRWPPATTS